ncbi:hypothetical protein COU60_00860 [Candidatus Pacearchaeota archaeon CG10_big_fil_rev_8_21_14_0_10_34_76]|nr:MAG: hypothetical protein COU60_00860 [Candidatus Pacearchaeota archaeon CG10_big_fil_rev_8_21_14_0_10_34_76]
MKWGIILCSGGLDSVVTAHYIKKTKKYDKIIVLFFDYGQKSVQAERKFSKHCALDLSADFYEIGLKELGKISTSLINKPGDVKKINKEDLKNTQSESEKWYVPARNLIFITYAIALAEKILIEKRIQCDIFLGFKSEGKEGYPDTSKDFVKAVNKIGEVGFSGKFKVFAPMIKKDKEDIVLLGKKLDVDFKKTFSCYIGSKEHCGTCLACRLRKEGFYWANIVDTTKYLE